MQNVSLKSLQEDAVDDISRRHFQMQIFLALLGLILSKISIFSGKVRLDISCESSTLVRGIFPMW